MLGTDTWKMAKLWQMAWEEALAALFVMCKCSSETISLQLEQSHSGPSCNIQQSSDNLGLSLSSLKCQTGAHQITQPFTSARQLIKRQIWAGRVNIKAYCFVIAHGGYQPGDLLTFLPVCSHFPAYKPGVSSCWGVSVNVLITLNRDGSAMWNGYIDSFK